MGTSFGLKRASSLTLYTTAASNHRYPRLVPAFSSRRNVRIRSFSAARTASVALYYVPYPDSSIQNASTTYPPLGISRTQTSKLTLGHVTTFLPVITPDISALHFDLSHGIGNAVQLSNYVCNPLFDSGKVLITSLSSSRRRSQVQCRCRRKLSLILLCLFLLVFVMIAMVLFIFILLRANFFVHSQVWRGQGGYIFRICLTPRSCQFHLSSSKLLECFCVVGVENVGGRCG